MSVLLKAIKFNHDSASANHDALNIRKNATEFVNVPEWRPDPTWSLTGDTGRKLENLCEGLKRYDGPAVSVPPLGYRGAFVRDDAGHEWFGYRGVVTVTGPQGSEAREDQARQFEQAVIASAPDGLLPAAVLSHEFE